MICGPFFLVASQITDVYYFLKHLYSKDLDKLLPFEKPKITMRGIKAISKVTKALLNKGKKQV